MPDDVAFLAGFEELLVSPANRDQNEIGFDVHHVNEHVVVHYLESRFNIRQVDLE